MIERFLELIPKSQKLLSGSVFYSGRAAFASPSNLYILGLNPGGSPEEQAAETVEWHTKRVLEVLPADWSAYCDESWQGAVPGTWGLQPRVLHMLRRLDLRPQTVPSSNVVFVRSRREDTLKGGFAALAADSWPFHQRVIAELRIKVVLCFGRSAGDWVARQLGAATLVAEFVEQNNRRWRSVALSNPSGIRVVTATHPGRADWTVPASDPTPLLQELLSRN